MLRLNIAGFTSCGYYRRARDMLSGLQHLYPNKVSVNINEHSTRDSYLEWLNTNREKLHAGTHKSSPFVWNEETNETFGCDGITDYVRHHMCTIAGLKNEGNSCTENVPSAIKNVDDFNADHGFDYDLIVIGGGSGGLSCSKEASKLGARVAVLDFVKPSPHGSTWGLGGTCVNVGCIPKKLMHTAALMGEHQKHAAEYGWKVEGTPVHDWSTMVSNVQDHIRGLNFGYKVALRDEGVTYLNKLGKFVGKNELEVVDKKGRASVISAARFVIAVGGRPTRLDIPGGEHAISSDDLFMLKEAPGKTCVLGAGYVALECAGFLTGLKNGDVTVLVRSMPLRGFDRDVVDKITDYMKEQGTKIVLGVTPQSIEKVPNTDPTKEKEQLKVTYSNGESDVFDTVLTAIGRRADTAGLNLEALGLNVNPNNGKIIASNEQTSVPHVYAIGDVVDKAPELTPVAIMAGKMLARRLVNASSDTNVEYMDYKNVATAVFTPLEMGTVGLSEDEAKSMYGAENVDSYLSSFTPLEYTVLHMENNPCIAKVVVNKMAGCDYNKVLGLHIAAPNAGEIIQGFGVAIKKGITYDDLMSTVGIHPTVAEELVQATVSKSSGESADKGGC